MTSKYEEIKANFAIYRTEQEQDVNIEIWLIYQKLLHSSYFEFLYYYTTIFILLLIKSYLYIKQMHTDNKQVTLQTPEYYLMEQNALKENK